MILLIALPACSSGSHESPAQALTQAPETSDKIPLPDSDGVNMGDSAMPEVRESEVQEPVAEPRGYDHIIIMGDSIMFASKEGPTTTTAHRIAQDDGLYVTNLSQSAQTMTNAVNLQLWGMVEFLAGSKNSDKKIRKALVIQLAHNDWGRVGLDVLRVNYLVMLNKVSALHVDTFCVVPVRARWDSEHHTNFEGAEYEDARNTVRELASSGQCELIETEDWFTDTDVFDGYTMPDGLHFGERGHLIFKNRLMEALN